MLLLVGTTVRDRVLTAVRLICATCGVTAPQQVAERATRFSLFFVPLFTLGRSHSLVCTSCGASSALTREQAEHGLAWAGRNGHDG